MMMHLSKLRKKVSYSLRLISFEYIAKNAWYVEVTLWNIWTFPRLMNILLYYINYNTVVSLTFVIRSVDFSSCEPSTFDLT